MMEKRLIQLTTNTLKMIFKTKLFLIEAIYGELDDEKVEVKKPVEVLVYLFLF